MSHSNFRIAKSAMGPATVSMAALLTCMIAAPAMAQDRAGVAAPQGAQQSANDSDIVVTGSRIKASGYTAPTPTTVIDSGAIEANAQPNIFTTIAQLPSLQGSSGTAVNTFSTSSGQQGLSSFSLRGVGAIRTLTLLDGQRVVGANVTGVPDISLFPQLLVQRVDVVNGGASASYGSDAVGGVVNFITDTRFKGFKGNVQGGISRYSDNEQFLVQLAAGTSFLDDRAHLVVSGEYADEKGVGGGDFGIGLAGGRDWFKQTSLIDRGAVNDGSPRFVLRDYAQAYNYTKYGLITSGPLQGTAFDQNGNPFQFNYGSGGVPARDGTSNVRNCFPGFCLGGDLSGNVDAGRTLQSAIKRVNSYARLGYDFADNDEL
ncbi:MAG: TonB-dependent receptor plug domain-containing protein, partial [Sphingobium limneticum]